MSIISAEGSGSKRYGFIGIIVTNREHSGARINKVLSAHSNCIIGRLGLPNVDNGSLAIITLIVHASTDELGALSGKLGALPGVSVKSALHKSGARVLSND